MTTEPENTPVEAPQAAADGPADPDGGYAYPDPAAFEDGDSIDSAAIDEAPDGYQTPAEPDAEPVEDHDDAEPGDD